MPPQLSGPPANMAMVAVEEAAVPTMYVTWDGGSLHRVGRNDREGIFYPQTQVLWPSPPLGWWVLHMHRQGHPSVKAQSPIDVSFPWPI
jgi:hypothetical protein